jgi:SulP family sulfate permease
MSGATYRSRVARSRPQQTKLDQVAGRLALFQLQGFIFFGTAHNIADRVKRRVDDPAKERPKYVILDFSRVSGLDTTASISFSKLIQEANGRDIMLAISSPNATIWRQLMQAGLCEPGDGFRVFSTLDKGVEWCEEQLLAELGAAQVEEAASAPEQFAQILAGAGDIAALMPYMERQEVAAGERLISQGDSTDTLYFVESGRLTAQLTRDDGDPKRLQSMGSGHILGEVGFYLGGNRTADVVADEASVVYRLSKADLQRMRHDDPAAASTLHHLVAILLAERVAFLTTVANNEENQSG